MTAYPQSPGYKTLQPETSLSAARAVESRASNLRDRCLGVLLGSERTADEIAVMIGEDRLSIRPRVAELLAMGKIEDTGLRRINASGRPAAVWRAVVKLRQSQMFEPEAGQRDGLPETLYS